MQDSLRVKIIDNSHIKGDNATNIGIYTNGTYENMKYSMYTKDYNGQKAIVIYADEGDKHIFLTLQLLDKSSELSLADENTLCSIYIMCLKKEIVYHQNHKICCVNLLCNNILYFALFAIDFFAGSVIIVSVSSPV